MVDCCCGVTSFFVAGFVPGLRNLQESASSSRRSMGVCRRTSRMGDDAVFFVVVEVGLIGSIWLVGWLVSSMYFNTRYTVFISFNLFLTIKQRSSGFHFFYYRLQGYMTLRFQLLVFTMWTTVRNTIRPERGPVDALCACQHPYPNHGRHQCGFMLANILMRIFFLFAAVFITFVFVFFRRFHLFFGCLFFCGTTTGFGKPHRGARSDLRGEGVGRA